jgi:hypothetical protein
MITLINGFPQGPNGLIVPNGSIKMQLNVDATVIAPPGGFVAADVPVVFQFDKNGALIQPAKIWSNEELDPQNTVGLGTFYLVTFYDQNGAILNNTPLWWIFPETIGATVDISQMVAISTVGGNLIYYPRSVGNSGTVTSIAFVGDGVVDSATPSAPVTTSGNITATLLTQSANTVLAGPTTGSAATPTFRALVTADLPPTVNIWNQLQSATGNLTLANTSFTSTFNQTTPAIWTWANITAATNSVNQSSPIFTFGGTAWNGAASALDTWTIQAVLATGTNPASTLTFLHTAGPGPTNVSFPGNTNIANNLVAAQGQFNNTLFAHFATGGSGFTAPLTAAANAVGALTTYTWSTTPSSGPQFGERVTITGFVTGANNGYFIVHDSTTTTLTVYNSSGVSETHAATATVDNPYVNNGGGYEVSLGNGSIINFGISGSNYTPLAVFQTPTTSQPVVLTAAGNAVDAEYLRLINDGATGNHGLEIGAIVDGVGTNVAKLQLGTFNSTTLLAVLNCPLTLAGATPTGTTGQISFGNTQGFGTGSAGTAVTTTTKGGGTGPATPQTVVNYLEVDVAGTKFWLPLVQ